MAQIVVDSRVMRDKASTLDAEANKIQTLYAEMLQEVNTMSSKMKGETIDIQRQSFSRMQSAFDTFVKDMKQYSSFLTSAAEEYEAAEAEGKMKAEEQGKIF